MYIIQQVKQHSESGGHKLKEKVNVNNTLLDAFCKTKPTPEDNKITAQEVSLVYHNVKHNLSYRSLDCNVKLLKHMLPDATKKITLGRTKAEALVLNVLGATAVDNVVQQLKNSNTFYAIQTDASNVKNRKFFPITVQYSYFNKDEGIINKIINFLENPDETAHKWTDSRNRASVQLIKNELCITLNFNKSCNEFYDYALATTKLLTESQRKTKYETK